jgi:hypothetical protein
MLNLFLDDCPRRTKIWAKAYPQGITTTRPKTIISLLKMPLPVRFLFLDHDVDADVQPYYMSKDPEDTGMEVVVWLEENKREIEQIIVHSQNGDAAPVMFSRLQAAGYNVVGCPFPYLEPQLGKVIPGI